MKRIFLAFCLVFGSNSVFANLTAEGQSLTASEPVAVNKTLTSRQGTFVKVSDGEASDKSKKLAIRLAILDAVQKSGGVSTDELFTFNAPRFVGEVLTQRGLSRVTKGRIDSYEVQSISEENGEYSAKVAVYKRLFTRTQKPTIAIFSNSYYTDLGENLRQKVQNSLVSSQKFSVLERKNADYYEAEKRLLKSEDASSEEAFKLGNAIGSDYLLVLNLREVGSAKRSGVAATGEGFGGGEEARVEVAVDYSLVFFATREVKLSNTLVTSVRLKEGGVKESEDGVAKIAAGLSEEILEGLYPLKVAGVSFVEGKFQAAFVDRLELGEVFECARGSVSVVSSGRYSLAEVKEGEVRVGDVCKTSSGAVGKNATYKLDGGGGVNLGW